MFANIPLFPEQASTIAPEVDAVTGLLTVISGFVETDDSDTWPQMHQSSKGIMGRQQKLRYQALVGDNKPQDWPGGGHVYDGFTKDDNQWNWWLRWNEFMTGKPW